MTLSDMMSAEQVPATNMTDPAFRDEGDRTAVTRAVATQVVAYRAEHGLS